MSEVVTISMEIQLNNGRGSELQIIGGTNCSETDTMSCKDKFIARLMVDGKVIAVIPSTDDPLFREFRRVIREYIALRNKKI